VPGRKSESQINSTLFLPFLAFLSFYITSSTFTANGGEKMREVEWNLSDFLTFCPAAVIVPQRDLR
jgi:hypothetical protein